MFSGVSAATQYPYWFTQMEALGARTFFPCQDSPMVRSTIKTTFVIEGDENLKAWATGEPISQTRSADGKTAKIVFATDFIVPAYLYAFVVGNYTEYTPAKYPEYTFVGEGSEAEVAANAEQALELMVDSKEYYEDKLSYKFPFDHMKIFLAPKEFPPAGMENQAFIFAGASYVQKDGIALFTSLMPHELIHHWFGNLITAEQWPDVGVNEGPTTYYDHRYQEERFWNLGQAAGNWYGNIFVSARAPQNRERRPEEGRVNGEWTGSGFPANFGEFAYQKAPGIIHEAETLVSFDSREAGQRRMDAAFSSMLQETGGSPTNMSTETFYRTLGNRLVSGLSTEFGGELPDGAVLPKGGLDQHLVDLATVPGVPYLSITCDEFFDNGRAIKTIHITQDDRQPYNLGRVHLSAFGPTGRTELEIDLNGEASVTINWDTFAPPLTSVFVDPKAGRWIQSNHCFAGEAAPLDLEFLQPSRGMQCDEKTKKNLRDLVPNLQPDDVRVISSASRACDDLVYQHAATRFADGSERDVLAEFSVGFQVAVNIAQVKASGPDVIEPLHLVEEMLRIAVEDEDFVRAASVLGNFRQLGFAEADENNPQIASLISYLREVMGMKQYPVFRNMPRMQLGMLDSQTNFIWQHFLDDVQHGAYDGARAYILYWLDSTNSRTSRYVDRDTHMTMRGRVRKALDDGTIETNFLRGHLESWLAKHERLDQSEAVGGK